VIRNGLVEPFNNLEFVDFEIFATEPKKAVAGKDKMPDDD
jgi:hypothetical protein